LERADIESILEKVEIVASDTTVTAYRLYVDATKLEEAQKLLEEKNNTSLLIAEEQPFGDHDNEQYCPAVGSSLN
jgi:hypothetical protein